MAGNFDDIIRGVLNMPQPYKEPPFGTQLGPMIDDWLSRMAPQGPQMNEGDMPPMTPLQQHSRKYHPITPIPNATDQTGAIQPIPNNDPEYNPGDSDRMTRYQKKHLSPMEKILNDMGLVSTRTNI